MAAEKEQVVGATAWAKEVKKVTPLRATMAPVVVAHEEELAKVANIPKAPARMSRDLDRQGNAQSRSRQSSRRVQRRNVQEHTAVAEVTVVVVVEREAPLVVKGVMEAATVATVATVATAAAA